MSLKYAKWRWRVGEQEEMLTFHQPVRSDLRV